MKIETTHRQATAAQTTTIATNKLPVGGATRSRVVQIPFANPIVAGHQLSDDDDVVPALITGFSLVESKLTSRYADPTKVGETTTALSVEFHGTTNNITVTDDGEIDFTGGEQALKPTFTPDSRIFILNLQPVNRGTNPTWALLPSRALGNPRVVKVGDSRNPNFKGKQYQHRNDDECFVGCDYSHLRSLTLDTIASLAKSDKNVGEILATEFTRWQEAEQANAQSGDALKEKAAVMLKDLLGALPQV